MSIAMVLLRPCSCENINRRLEEGPTPKTFARHVEEDRGHAPPETFSRSMERRASVERFELVYSFVRVLLAEAIVASPTGQSRADRTGRASLPTLEDPILDSSYPENTSNGPPDEAAFQ